jgi:hypothetical protein
MSSRTIVTKRHCDRLHGGSRASKAVRRPGRLRLPLSFSSRYVLPQTSMTSWVLPAGGVPSVGCNWAVGHRARWRASSRAAGCERRCRPGGLRRHQRPSRGWSTRKARSRARAPLASIQRAPALRVGTRSQWCRSSVARNLKSRGIAAVQGFRANPNGVGNPRRVRGHYLIPTIQTCLCADAVH